MIKVSMFKKLAVGDILGILLRGIGFELIGLKVIDCKK
jgi:hypothetical protein